jgi:hypothetical protein
VRQGRTLLKGQLLLMVMLLMLVLMLERSRTTAAAAVGPTTAWQSITLMTLPKGTKREKERERVCVCVCVEVSDDVAECRDGNAARGREGERKSEGRGC